MYEEIKNTFMSSFINHCILYNASSFYKPLCIILMHATGLNIHISFC